MENTHRGPAQRRNGRGDYTMWLVGMDEQGGRGGKVDILRLFLGALEGKASFKRRSGKGPVRATFRLHLGSCGAPPLGPCFV